MKIVIIGAGAAGRRSPLMGMISRPSDIYTDPHIVSRTHETLQEHVSDGSIVQPPREQVLAALNQKAGHVQRSASSPESTAS